MTPPPFSTYEPSGPGGEMRPVTALFADVVGSTALGERLGPDEIRALVGEVMTRMSRVVEGLGGLVQAYMGDGIAAYFGFPEAHEDDPERAARAALRIIDLVQIYGREVEEAWGISGFQVRVGVNTGPTAVGLIGAGDPQPMAHGDALNVAARLQSAAAPGTVLVGESTARHLSRRFVLEPLGDLTVKGRTEAVPAWRLDGPAVEGEEDGGRPFVDRAAEMERLRNVLREVRAGRGQVLLLTGETGMGKHRLLGELRRESGPPVTWLSGACLSWEAVAASGPFVQILRQWLGVREGDPDVAVRARLRANLGQLMGSKADSVLPSMSMMLSLRPDPAEDQSGVSSRELADRIRAGYGRWVESLAGRGPVVLAVEHLHWADQSTREILEALLELTDRAPLLLVCTLRPEAGSEGWRFRLQVQSEFSHRLAEVSLGPLPDAAVEDLAASIVPFGLDRETRREVVARAEGNPLYVEQLVEALREHGSRRGGTWTLSLTAADLPPPLEGLLVARIDRLPEGPRHLAQLAAVVGRSFSVRVLERVAGSDIASDLGALLRAGIVREVRRYPEFECTFQHGLVHEAALSTLLPANRRRLYGRVGAALEELHAGSLEDHLEALAFAFYRSDDQRRALVYLERAAEQAEASGDPPGAERLLRRALKVADTHDPNAVGRIRALLDRASAP